MKTLIYSLVSALVMGASCFVFGFIGPLVFVPGANQGPLLGIFILGPAGFVLGGLVGGVVAQSKSSTEDKLFSLGGQKAPRVWKKLLITVSILAIILVAVASFQIPWHEQNFSPSIANRTDIENRDQSLTELRVRFLVDEDLMLLSKFKQLRLLDFQSGWGRGDAKLTDQGLRYIASLNLPELEQILLGYCVNITDEGMKHLVDMKSLKHLNVNNCPKITDNGLAILSSSTSLRKLNLNDCRGVTDKGLDHLKRMKQLDKIWLLNNNLSEHSVNKLRKALPNTKIWSEY